MKALINSRRRLYAVVIIASLFFSWLYSYEMALNYSFNGVVEKVRYDVQGTPTVTIRGIEYNLVYNKWGNNSDTIEPGDSMRKRRGDIYIKLIKHRDVTP